MTRRRSFDRDYYARFYEDAPVHTRTKIAQLAQAVHSFAQWWEVGITSVLDIGAGPGYWRDWYAEHHPDVERSRHDCRRRDDRHERHTTVGRVVPDEAREPLHTDRRGAVGQQQCRAPALRPRTVAVSRCGFRANRSQGRERPCRRPCGSAGHALRPPRVTWGTTPAPPGAACPQRCSP